MSVEVYSINFFFLPVFRSVKWCLAWPRNYPQRGMTVIYFNAVVLNRSWAWMLVNNDRTSDVSRVQFKEWRLLWDHGLCELNVNTACFRVFWVEDRRGELFLDSCYRAKSPHTENAQQLITCRGSHSQGSNSHPSSQLSVHKALRFLQSLGVFTWFSCPGFCVSTGWHVLRLSV